MFDEGDIEGSAREQAAGEYGNDLSDPAHCQLPKTGFDRRTLYSLKFEMGCGPGATSMNKRTFRKFCSAAMTSRFLAPVLGWAAGNRLMNWAGNVEYGTEKLYTAHSEERAREFVRKQNRLKVLGTRHCFNRIADSRDQFLSLKAMDKVVALDSEARTVTVEAGMSYGQLCPYLDDEGWALHNLASLPHISIAGACSTATHGSGEKNGNLATAVAGLEMVNAAGDVVKLTRAGDGETLRGAAVGLGALGAITKVTLDIQPRFTMQQYVYEDLPLSELKDHFDAIEGAAYSVSLFTDWQKQRVNEVWLKVRMDEGRRFDAPAEFFGAKRPRRTCIRSRNCRRRTAPGRWECRDHGMSGCRTSAWDSRRARGRNCSRSTSCQGSRRWRRFWRWSGCTNKWDRTC